MPSKKKIAAHLPPSPLNGRTERIILLAVTGLSPAIVTETVWALAQEKPRVLPQRVVFITTSVGAGKIKEQLFSPVAAFQGQTAWAVLRAALKAKDDELIAEESRVIGQANQSTGTFDPLADIQTRVENDLAAGFILEEVRRVVENSDLRLIASIAGGRKTMGALLHAAVSLIGRESDRLTHVLVSAPYETMPGFYFPDQPGPSLKDRTGNEHPPSKAEVFLADVPFVPLRNRFKELDDMPGDFHVLTKKFSRRLKEDAARPVRVAFNLPAKKLLVDGQRISMRIKAQLILRYLIESPDAKDHQEAADAFFLWLEKTEATTRNFCHFKALTAEDVRHEISHLKTTLEKHQLRWPPPPRTLDYLGFVIVD